MGGRERDPGVGSTMATGSTGVLREKGITGVRSYVTPILH